MSLNLDWTSRGGEGRIPVFSLVLLEDLLGFSFSGCLGG